MSSISYLETTSRDTASLSFDIPTDESVGGMLFDISGFSNPFSGYDKLYYNFKDNQVRSIYNMDDAKAIGIEDNGFLNGMLYYHVSEFYKYIGSDQVLYICLADCTNDWDAVALMHRMVNGKMFQIGIWTSQPIWRYHLNGNVNFMPLIKALQEQADDINGKVGSSTGALTPVSLILFPNTNDDSRINYKNIPDAKILECPKVSVVLCQNGTEEVHNMQALNPKQAPVSNIGVVMAILSEAGVEASIASTMNFDLNKNDDFTSPELGFGNNHSPISNINQVRTNIISTYGYILPVAYDGFEASCFLSSDQTLSNGDLSTIANNRTIHKCRRAIGNVLLPFVNGNHPYDPNIKMISLSAQTQIQSSIAIILSSIMLNRRGFKQIEGHRVTFSTTAEEVLSNDTISLTLDIEPANYSGYISEEVSINS